MSLKQGDRVQLRDKTRRFVGKGVLARCEQEFFVVVLDVPRSPGPPQRIEGFARQLGVDPRQCVIVPRRKSDRIELLLHEQRQLAKPEAMFLCSVCERPDPRRNLILLCRRHQACWRHLIPEDADPDTVQQMIDALRDFADENRRNLTEEDLQCRALLVYEQYCAVEGDQQQQLLQDVILQQTYRCAGCRDAEVPSFVSVNDVARQFAQKDKHDKSLWEKACAMLADFWRRFREPTAEACNERAELATRIVDELVEQGRDPELCLVAVENALRNAPVNVNESQLLTFCYEELRQLEQASSGAEAKPEAKSYRDAALTSSSSLPFTQESSRKEAVVRPVGISQTNPKSGSPRHRSGQPASSPLTHNAADKARLVERLRDFGVVDANVAREAIAIASTKYPNVRDESRFLQYCLDEVPEPQLRTPVAALGVDAASTRGRSDEHCSGKVDECKASSVDRAEPRAYTTRSKAKRIAALKAKYRAELIGQLEGMSYLHDNVVAAIDAVLARSGDLPESATYDEVLHELLGRCVDELGRTQRKPVEAEAEVEAKQQLARSPSQAGEWIEPTVAANVGRVLVSGEQPMDIEDGNSHRESEDQDQQAYQHTAPPECVTEADLRISARCARVNDPLVQKIPKGTSYDDLREVLLQKFQQHFAEPDAADPSNYKLYLELENDFCTEIVPPSHTEREEPTVLVTELKKNSWVSIWHVNENVGPKQPLAVLASNFKFNRSMQQKIAELQRAHGYEGWRRIRGDGNCYYRAVLFGYLEQVIAHPRRAQLLDAFLQTMEAVQYERGSTDEEQHEALLHELRAAIKLSQWKTAADFRARIVDPATNIDHALVRAVRRVIGAYLMEHAQDDFNGITLADTILSSYEVASMADYVERYVLTLGEDAEGAFVYLGIMFKALGIGGRTVFLDRRDDVDLAILRTPEEAEAGEGEMPVNVHLLLRPGHYDLLYLAAPSASV